MFNFNDICRNIFVYYMPQLTNVVYKKCNAHFPGLFCTVFEICASREPPYVLLNAIYCAKNDETYDRILLRMNHMGGEFS